MNMDDLNMGELRQLQLKLKLPAEKLSEDAFGLMAGIAWLVKRREDKSFTFEQALELTQAEVAEIIGEEEDPKA